MVFLTPLQSKAPLAALDRGLCPNTREGCARKVRKWY